LSGPRKIPTCCQELLHWLISGNLRHTACCVQKELDHRAEPNDHVTIGEWQKLYQNKMSALAVLLTKSHKAGQTRSKELAARSAEPAFLMQFKKVYTVLLVGLRHASCNVHVVLTNCLQLKQKRRSKPSQSLGTSTSPHQGALVRNVKEESELIQR
jgi:hypothetical protein